MGELDGKIALVTGASRGIGRAIAVALARAGADVGLVQRGAAEETVSEIEAAGRRAFVVQADLENAAAAEDAVGRVADELGRLDAVVCNAGMTSRTPMLELELEDFRRVIDVNLIAPFVISRAAARLFVAQGGGGRVIHIASVMAFFGGINIGPYTASKGGVAQLARAQSNEWAPLGITVNAIAPGYIATDLNAVLRSNPGRYAEINARIPLGRWGGGDDIAGLVVWLCTPAADYVSGSLLTVDGGYTAR
jgi:2-deoxy-D-gluconate 3-dehydrogenase